MRFLFLLVGLLSAAHAWSQQTNLGVSDARVVAVYIHNCCGRAPYVAAQLDKQVGTAGSCAAGGPNIVAIPVSDPMARYLYATALAAKNSGASVDVFYNESCGELLVFRTWVGIFMH